MASQLAASGADLNDTQVQVQISDRALTSLLNRTMLKDAAVASGAVADSVAVDAQYAAIVEQAGGADALAQQASAAGISVEQIKTDLADDSQITVHLTAQLNLDSITISEADIQTRYNEAVAGATAETVIPELSEITDQIEQQLRSEAEQLLINDYLDTIAETADIQIFL